VLGEIEGGKNTKESKNYSNSVKNEKTSELALMNNWCRIQGQCPHYKTVGQNKLKMPQR